MFNVKSIFLTLFLLYQGSIIEATPTPTTDPQVNPLTSEIKNQDVKSATKLGLPKSSLLEKPVPVTQSETVVKSESDSPAVTVKQEPGVVQPSGAAVARSSSPVPHSDGLHRVDDALLVTIKQEPVSSDSTSEHGAESVRVTADTPLLSVIKTEPVSQDMDSSQTLPEKTEVVTDVKSEFVAEVKTEVKQDA